MFKIVTEDVDSEDLASVLDDLVTEGAQRVLITALEAEVADYMDRHQNLTDGVGHRLVVRNGRAEERTLVTAAGALKIRAPRVNDKRNGHSRTEATAIALRRLSPKTGSTGCADATRTRRGSSA